MGLQETDPTLDRDPSSLCIRPNVQYDLMEQLQDQNRSFQHFVQARGNGALRTVYIKRSPGHLGLVLPVGDSTNVVAYNINNQQEIDFFLSEVKPEGSEKLTAENLFELGTGKIEVFITLEEGGSQRLSFGYRAFSKETRNNVAFDPGHRARTYIGWEGAY